MAGTVAPTRLGELTNFEEVAVGLGSRLLGTASTCGIEKDVE
jgi:hypothetical protein